MPFTESRPMTRLPQLAVLVLLPLALAACGGRGGDSAAAAPQGAASGATAQVTGISTPSGVSVVTAKNAQ